MADDVKALLLSVGADVSLLKSSLKEGERDVDSFESVMADLPVETQRAIDEMNDQFKGFASSLKKSVRDSQVSVRSLASDFKDSASKLDVGGGASGIVNLDGARAAAAAAHQRADALEGVSLAAQRAAAAEGNLNSIQARTAAAAIQAAAASRAEALALAQKVGALEAVQVELLAMGRAEDRTVVATRGSGMAAIQASQQVQDFLIQVQGGQSILTAFAQQGSQMAIVLSNVGGTVGKVAGIFAGPWGIAVLAATTILGPLIAGQLGAGDAAESHGKAVKTLEDRLEDLAQATSGAIKNSYDQRRASIAAAEGMLSEAEAARQAAIAQLQLAKARVQDFSTSQRLMRQSRGDPGSTGALGALGALEGAAELDVRRFDAQIANLNTKIVTTAASLRQARIPDLQAEITASRDKAAAANLRYEKTESALNERFTAGKISEQEYNAAITRAQTARDAASEADKRGGSERGRHAKATLSAVQAERELLKATDDLIARSFPFSDSIQSQIQLLNRLANAGSGVPEGIKPFAFAPEASFDEQLKTSTDKQLEALGTYFDAYEQRAAEAQQFAADQFETLFNSGIDGVWDNFERAGLRVIAIVAAKMAISLLSGKGLGDIGGFFSSALGSIFGFADGGSPPVGKVSMVGERGPELFVPRVPGTIISNDNLSGLGGGRGGDTYVINAPGATAETVQLIRRELRSFAPTLVQTSKQETYRDARRARI